MGLRRHDHFKALILLLMSLLILGSPFARAESAADDDLVKLARKHFNYDLITSEQERQAFDKFFLSTHQGNEANFWPENSADRDVSKGNSWGPERTVRAEWIAWLCKDPDAVKMVQTTTGIQINGAKIDGEVKMSWLHLQFPLAAAGCYFTDRFILRGASLLGLDLEGAYIAGSPDKESLVGVNLTVQGNVNLVRCVAQKPVWFANAKITERFLAKSAEFHGKQWSLNLTSANIGVDVDLNSARAVGPIKIARSTIGGDLDCRGAKIHLKVSGTDRELTALDVFVLGMRAETTALDATAAKIDGDVFMGSAANVGYLSFFAANIGGTFELGNSEPTQEAILYLLDAKASVLTNEEKSWPKPKNLRLEGFVFSELGGQASKDPETQIKWLRLQSPFAAQPYEQMATVFRNMGYEEKSVKVSIAGKWDEGITSVQNDIGAIRSRAKELGRDLKLGRLGKIFLLGGEVVKFVLYDLLWYRFFGRLIGYGYRPWNALFVSIGFVVVGMVIFGRAEKRRILKKADSTKTNPRRLRWRKKDRNFSAFIYSLETFVPLVNLGVARDWRIDGNATTNRGKASGIWVLRYYWIHIICGWIFTSLWVAAFTGILKH